MGVKKGDRVIILIEKAQIWNKNLSIVNNLFNECPMMTKHGGGI
jgi:hypothetical protein